MHKLTLLFLVVVFVTLVYVQPGSAYYRRSGAAAAQAARAARRRSAAQAARRRAGVGKAAANYGLAMGERTNSRKASIMDWDSDLNNERYSIRAANDMYNNREAGGVFGDGGWAGGERGSSGSRFRGSGAYAGSKGRASGRFGNEEEDAYERGMAYSPDDEEEGEGEQFE